MTLSSFGRKHAWPSGQYQVQLSKWKLVLEWHVTHTPPVLCLRIGPWNGGLQLRFCVPWLLGLYLTIRHPS